MQKYLLTPFSHMLCMFSCAVYIDTAAEKMAPVFENIKRWRCCSTLPNQSGPIKKQLALTKIFASKVYID